MTWTVGSSSTQDGWLKASKDTCITLPLYTSHPSSSKDVRRFSSRTFCDDQKAGARHGRKRSDRSRHLPTVGCRWVRRDCPRSSALAIGCASVRKNSLELTHST